MAPLFNNTSMSESEYAHRDFMKFNNMIYLQEKYNIIGNFKNLYTVHSKSLPSTVAVYSR